MDVKFDFEEFLRNGGFASAMNWDTGTSWDPGVFNPRARKRDPIPPEVAEMRFACTRLSAKGWRGQMVCNQEETAFRVHFRKGHTFVEGSVKSSLKEALISSVRWVESVHLG